jgi:hypothetical protein
MKKIRLIIEAEVEENETITPEIIKRAWGSYSNYHELLQDKEWMYGVKHEQAFLDALLANPKQYRETLLSAAFAAIEGMAYQKFYEMTGVPTEFAATFRSIIPLLPAESAAFFQEMDEKGVLSENTELVSSAINLEIKSIKVEGIEPTP